MKLTISSKNTKKSSRNKLQKRFEKLQSKLSKEKKILEKMKKQVDLMVNQYNDFNHKLNKQYLDQYELLALKLVIFASRKSLTHWQRDEVHHWFSDIHFKVQSVSVERARELSLKMEQAHADFIGVSVQELRDDFEEMQREEEEFEKDVFGDFDLREGDPQKSEPLKDDGAPFQDDFFAEDFAQFYENDEDNIFDEGLTTNDSPALMSEQWIRHLFRRTAKELHPDKEQDPKQKLIKQEKMAELLNARKKSDIMTMLTIYSEYFNPDDMSFAENEMETICQLIDEQILQLKEDELDYLYGHPHREMIYDLVYNPSKKKQQQNFREMTEALKEDCHYELNAIGELKTIKQLKNILIERKERYRPKIDFDSIFGGEFDFKGL